MREVIQQVIAAEAGAKQLIQAAQVEAEQLLSEARRRAQEILERARQESRIEAEQILATAVAQANLEKAGQLKRAAAGINDQVRLDEAMKSQVASAAVRCVCRSG